MSKTNEMTLSEIRSKGYEALYRELGPAGFIRFIRQFEAGHGDYTKERQEWVDKLTLEEIIRDLPDV